MKKKLLYFIGAGVVLATIVLTLVFLLGEKGYYIKNDPDVDQNHWNTVYQMYQTSTAENDKNYSGLLSGIRTGGCRKAGSLTSGEYECTESGVYFLNPGMLAYHDGTEVSVSYLFYLEHDSNTVIKLCGRPDCTHDTFDCNAVFLEGYGSVTYYDGYLYVATFSNGLEIVTLYRLNPDGSNRVAVLDCGSVNQGQYSSYTIPRFQNGVFMIGLSYIESTSGEMVTDWFYCKLDGKRYELKNAVTGYCWNDGEAFIHGAVITEESGTTSWQLFQWDPETNTEKEIASFPNMEAYADMIGKAYWGKNNGLAHHEGRILMVSYPNCDFEVLFETGITGANTTRFFPDCIAVHEKADEEIGENGTIHFFDYQGNKLGTADIDIPTNSSTALIIGESRDRIFLGSNLLYRLPTYCIEKSEFTDGNMELHKLNYPDLSESLQKDLFYPQQIE